MMSRSLCLAFGLVLAALSLGSCSNSHMQAGTDGVTHWLRDCDSSAECGELQCLCGVCTRSCEENASCGDLGVSAECVAAQDSSCTPDLKTCQRSESVSGGFGGTGGRDAATDAGAGGDAMVRPLDGGERDAAAGDGGELDPARCGAMDARSNGTFCDLTLGFSWNGSSCEEVLCGCTGAECAEIYATQAECKRAHLVCLGLTRCTEPSECELAPADCCACRDLGPAEVVAVASAQRNDYEASFCAAVDCIECAIDPLAKTRARAAATCKGAPTGQERECVVFDLTRLPCTEAVGCRVRVPQCCECGVMPTVDEVFAMPNDFKARGTLCDLEAVCCDEGPSYPENVEARCVNAVCELFEDGVLVPR